MHHRLLVTTRNAASPEDARKAVTAGLIEQGFVDDPTTRWSGGIADWFVTGGRFSNDLGGSDDAQLVTDELYDDYLAEYEGFDTIEGFADLEREPVSRQFINRKWLVVVDYHD